MRLKSCSFCTTLSRKAAIFGSISRSTSWKAALRIVELYTP
jgi:hypothetical protein